MSKLTSASLKPGDRVRIASVDEPQHSHIVGMVGIVAKGLDGRVRTTPEGNIVFHVDGLYAVDLPAENLKRSDG